MKFKSTPLKRWYRVKDNVIYDILTVEPDKEVVKDAISWKIGGSNESTFDEVYSKLPRMKITYGFLENHMTLTDVEYTEYEYMDNLIEVGDSFTITDGFKPQRNNGEFNNAFGGYLSIYRYGIIKEMEAKITQGFNPQSILDTIPYYFRDDNKITVRNPNNKLNPMAEVWNIEPKSVRINGQLVTVNCVKSVATENDVNDSMMPIDFKKIVIESINKYCQNIAEEMCVKQGLVKDVDYTLGATASKPSSGGMGGLEPM